MRRLPLIAGLLCLSLGAPIMACDRDALFGGWADLDGHGLDAREKMLLAADRGGWWLGRYDGVPIYDRSKVDVDHVVPLCLAVQWGASAWTRAMRVRFANDPLNLAITGQSSNRSKAARPFTDWMPRNLAAWPEYLMQVQAVIERYPLEVPDEERAALACYARFARESGKGFRPGKWDCK